MINQQEIDDYVNKSFTEQLIRGYENQLLAVLKSRQEKFPSEKNNDEWLSFTDWVCKRRYGTETTLKE